MQDNRLQQYARDRVEDLPGAGVHHPFGPDWEVFKVRDKVFMLMTEVTGEPIVIVKADPEDGRALRDQHEDITPGYHMNKQPAAREASRRPQHLQQEGPVILSGEQLQQTARDAAASLPDVSNGRPFTPHLEVWKVRDKVFLIVTDDDPDQQIITVKVDPHHGDALRRDHDSITPGRYLNKNHWISIGSGRGVTKRLIDDLVHSSYELAAGQGASGYRSS